MKGSKPRKSFPHPQRQDEPELTPSAPSQTGEEAAASQEAPESTEHWAGGGKSVPTRGFKLSGVTLSSSSHGNLANSLA